MHTELCKNWKASVLNYYIIRAWSWDHCFCISSLSWDLGWSSDSIRMCCVDEEDMVPALGISSKFRTLSGRQTCDRSLTLPSTMSEVTHSAVGAQRREQLLKAWGNEALLRSGIGVGSQSIRRLPLDKGHPRQMVRCEQSPGGVTTPSTRTELTWAEEQEGRLQRSGQAVSAL